MKPYLAFLLSLLLVPSALAQFGGRDIAGQALLGTWSPIDFSYEGGDEDPFLRYDFSNPAYGVTYLRPNFEAHLVFGRQTVADGTGGTLERDLTDAAIETWASLPFLPEFGGEALRLTLPILLHSDYRRVGNSESGNDENPADDFNFTTIGLGFGLGVENYFSDRALLEARVIPALGLALRSFGDATGRSALLTAAVTLHTAPFAGRFGLSLGYSFRWQDWNVNASSVFRNNRDIFDYRSTQHLVRIGLNW